jgi:hypothetical protein
MEPAPSDRHIEQFVFELLRTGLMLCNLVSDLIESMPADAYPGEDPGAVVLEMLCGTIATKLGSAEPREVRRATELMDQAGAATVEHLKLASEISRRIHGSDGAGGRAYG